MNRTPWSRAGWINFLLFWIIVASLSGVVVYATFLSLAAAVAVLPFPAYDLLLILIASPLAGGLGGAVAGLGQWLALRRRLPFAHSWALVTIISWILGLVLAAAIFAWLLPDGVGYSTLLIPFALGGGAAGLVQERLLSKWVSGRAWWVLASASGWVLGWIAALGTAALSGQGANILPGLALIRSGAIHGAVIGLQTGMTLVVLIRFVPFQHTGGGSPDGE